MDNVCTYCGREGHRASHCPWRVIAASALAVLLAGCDGGLVSPPPTQVDGWKRYEGPRTWAVAYEFKLEDGTRCVGMVEGGVTCDWRRP